LEVYREVCAEYGHITNVISGDIKFRKETLEPFLGTIGFYEKGNFENKLVDKDNYFKDSVLEGCSSQIEDVWEVDIEKYKVDYLAQRFSPGTKTQKLCHDYLEGMQWVISYYTKGVPNWKWNYPYHFAPPASIIAQHVSTFKFPKYPKTVSSTPFQQLLCVLPPRSANLIPSPLCDLLTDDNSPIKQFCPDDFKVDLSGKRREWEGIVILPIVNFDLVRQCYLELVDKIDPRDMKRNMLGKSFVYRYLPDVSPKEIKSYYGDIKECYVRTVLLDL